MQSSWGETLVKVQRLKSSTGKQAQIYLDASLDESGWSPEALARLVDLGTRLPYEEAALVAQRFGLELSRSLLDKLTLSCARSGREQVASVLSSEQVRVLPKMYSAGSESSPESSVRKLVLEVDGVCVPGRPEQGQCPGLEIKSAVWYPQDSPSQRWMLAERCKAEAFLPLLAYFIKLS